MHFHAPLADRCIATNFPMCMLYERHLHAKWNACFNIGVDLTREVKLSFSGDDFHVRS